MVPLYWVFITVVQARRAAVANGPFYIPFVDFAPSLHAWDFMLVQNNTLGSLSSIRSSSRSAARSLR